MQFWLLGALPKKRKHTVWLPEGFVMASDLIDFVNRWGEPKLLVVGDVILDRYVWGHAERVSQEAPVVLLRTSRREERLGGAASVATMLRAFGARVSVAGVVGRDRDAHRVRDLIEEHGIEQGLLLDDSRRPTTVKERFLGLAQQRHPQQMLRVDSESRDPISESIERHFLAVLQDTLEEFDAILISDYGKGVCGFHLLRLLIEQGRLRNIPILVDPERGGDYRKYRGCTLVTPNRLEASLATGRTIDEVPQAMQAAEHLCRDWDFDASIVTLDKDGMVLATRNDSARHFPTRPRQVYDITGAGDMVLAVIGMSLAEGGDFATAVRLANVAGGLEVERIGVSTLSRADLIGDLLRLTPEDKVFDLTELLMDLENRRRAGQTIVFTNGCFDVLHAGHVQYLREAKLQGDWLVVGLNSDRSVRNLKGPDRPINNIETRTTVLAALQFVDAIVVFDEQTPMRLIQEIRPDVLVKAGDYCLDEIVGADFVQGYGGRVHIAAYRPGISTTELVRRIRAA
jgi:D-beta-D-heptose 7-phosphate kinase/D-beta-D-heptose 1-phosphate adenosyltransferase